MFMGSIANWAGVESICSRDIDVDSVWVSDWASDDRSEPVGAGVAVIAVTSWAHISEYSASVAAIAAVFCPKMLVAISVISRARLAATAAGGTVAMNAASNAPADNRAWLAASSAWADVALNHST
jgi:hypothetical protein